MVGSFPGVSRQGDGDYGLRPKRTIALFVPGAMPQATVTDGLRPTTNGRTVWPARSELVGLVPQQKARKHHKAEFNQLAQLTGGHRITFD